MSTDETTLGTAASSRRRTGLRINLLAACALVGGAIGGTGGFALAAGGPWQGGWAHGHRLEHMQAAVRRALDSVGATTAQEDKIHDIVAAAFTKADADRETHREVRQKMIDLLRAGTIDKAAVEKLRSDEIAALDARSKEMVGALLDAADQLSPDQRAKLADRLQAMMDHHGMGGRFQWQGGEGQDGRGPFDGDRHGPGSGPGPGPQDGPDKG